MSDKLTHTDLKKALQNRYAFPHWILMEEVKNRTGFEWTRSADAVAFGLYASRGHEIHMFECKASRADFMSEIRDPAKSEEMAQHADRFFIVAPTGILKKSELPVGWGLIGVSRHGDGYKTRILKQAEPTTKQGPIERPFAASMIVRLTKELQIYRENSILKRDVSKRMQERFSAGIALGKSTASHGPVQVEAAYERLKLSVQRFEENSGVSLNDWNGGHVGDLFNIMSKVRDDHVARGALHRWGSMVSKLADALKELEEYVGDRKVDEVVEKVMSGDETKSISQEGGEDDAE